MAPPANPALFLVAKQEDPGKLRTVDVVSARDLIKPQWRSVIELLKASGSLPVASIRETLGEPYMTAKAHCEELTKRGYLERTKARHGGTGRPVIQYSLTSKAEALFAESDSAFALDILVESKNLFGEIAPERLVHQWFQKKARLWGQSLAGVTAPEERARRLAELRSADGWLCVFDSDARRLIDHHHPLWKIYQSHDRMATIEVRVLEGLLGAALTRHEISTGRHSMPKIIYEFA